jgi:charged multivesicular body protein 4
MALKRKKAYEDQIEKIMGAKMTLETQVMAIESANINLETMQAMKAGAEAMKTIHGSLYVFFCLNRGLMSDFLFLIVVYLVPV